MELRFLSGISSGRTSERHRRNLRRGPRRFRIRMAGVFIEAHRGRFSGIRAVGRWQAALIAPRTATGWKRPFDEPIRLSRGGKLVTLEDAGDYITELPKVDHTAAEWQAAMEALILVATLGGPTMFARIGIMRALNRGHVREFNSSRKDTHWGRRKLARDR